MAAIPALVGSSTAVPAYGRGGVYVGGPTVSPYSIGEYPPDDDDGRCNRLMQLDAPLSGSCSARKAKESPLCAGHTRSLAKNLVNALTIRPR